MSMAIPWRVRPPEKTSKITMLFNHMYQVGDVVLVRGKLLMVVGIEHSLGRFGTSTLEVLEPSWRWKFKYYVRMYWSRVTAWADRWWRKLWE
jgi:hypothetical protein